MLCTYSWLLETRVHTDGIPGEINYDYFFGQLPTNRQSDYAREQNCKISYPGYEVFA